MLHKQIEKKLSSLLGREVTAEKLKFAILGGRVDAAGITIAGESPQTPLATIGQLRAEVPLSKAIGGQLAVRGLVIDQATLPKYRLAANKIEGELHQKPGAFTFELRVDSLVLEGQPTQFGPARITGQFVPLSDLSELGRCPIEARIELPGGFAITLRSQGIASRKVELEFHPAPPSDKP